MNAKALKILVVVTLVCVFAALAVQKLGSPGNGADALPERVVPTLADKLNDIAAIEITSGGESITLARAGDTWTLASKDGYPAKFETVKALLVGLAELQPRERKTADPALYARLGLADPGPESEALGVTLTGVDGSTVADLVLGEQVQSGSAQQRFVRASGDPQAWLAEGRVDAPTDPMRWLDTAVTQIPRDRVRRVTITHADGSVVSIAREQGGSDYALESVPEGRTPKSAGEVGAPASALVGLRFDDVRKGDAPADAPEPVVAVYETTDDLRVTIRSWQADGKTWAAISAEATAPQAAPADPENPSPEPPAETPQDRADALNAKLAGWLFSLPQYQAGQLRKTMDDLTQAPPEEPAPEGDDPASVPFLDAADDGPDGE